MHWLKLINPLVKITCCIVDLATPLSHFLVCRCYCRTWVKRKGILVSGLDRRVHHPTDTRRIVVEAIVACLVFIRSAFNWLTAVFYKFKSAENTGGGIGIKVLHLCRRRLLKEGTLISWVAGEWVVYKESSSSHVNIPPVLSRQFGGWGGSTESVWSLQMSSVTNVLSCAISSGPGLFSRAAWKPWKAQLICNAHSHIMHTYLHVYICVWECAHDIDTHIHGIECSDNVFVSFYLPWMISPFIHFQTVFQWEEAELSPETSCLVSYHSFPYTFSFETFWDKTLKTTLLVHSQIVTVAGVAITVMTLIFLEILTDVVQLQNCVLLEIASLYS